MAVALAGALALAACGADPVRDTVERLYEATTPPMGWASTLLYAREPAVVNASWEIEMTESWDQYVTFVRSRAASDGFTLVATKTAEAVFRRDLDGDTQTLQLDRRVTNAGPSRVAVTFTSRPF